MPGYNLFRVWAPEIVHSAIPLLAIASLGTLDSPDTWCFSFLSFPPLALLDASENDPFQSGCENGPVARSTRYVSDPSRINNRHPVVFPTTRFSLPFFLVLG